MKNPYVPIVINDIKIGGITTETIPNGATGKILQRAFVTSIEPRFQKYSKEILRLFINPQEISSINRLLVIIKQDDTAYVYRSFPVQLGIRVKEGMKKGELLNTDNISDIYGVFFKDDFFQINIEDGDKIVWLTRNDLKYGLYFDFTGITTNTFKSQELGYYYKLFIYNELFSFITNQDNFQLLLDDGWFPFIRLVGNSFDKLIQYYLEDKKYESYVKSLLDSFTPDRIKDITAFWWSNPVLKEKQPIIEAGLASYYQFSDSGYINCIKTLSSEVEGIIRNACYREKGINKPTTQNIKDFIIEKGKSKFPNNGALGFPELFNDYLNKVVFKGFDIADSKIPTSRHSVAHGVAKFDNYTQIRAFQIIMVIDQIVFFL